MKSFYKLFLFVCLLGFSNSIYSRVDTVHISTQNPTCFGSTDGFVTIDSLTTSGTTGPYTIRINTTPVQFFNVGDTVFNLRTGNFTITVFDQGDFTTTFTNFTILEPTQVVSFLISSPPSCFGNCDGTATVFPGGGIPPYTFLWSDSLSQDSSTATGLCDGKFFVTVTDANNCSIVDSINVVEPTQIQPNVSVSDVLCNGGSTGSATASPSGGTGTYTNFAWSSSGNTTSTENNLAQGTYTVTVTDSDGCTNSETFTVNQPPTLTINLTKSDVACFGESTGSITNNPSGGTSPYSYAWSDGPDTTQNRSNILAGTYTVTVTDFNGCTQSSSITINQRPALTLSLSKTDVLCNGNTTGDATATIGGGTPNYSFSWSNSVNGSGDSSTISNLAAGIYTITVTDALNCELIDSIEITEPTPIAISLDSANTNDPSCVGGSDGEIDINVSGGTPNYTYNWSNAASSQDISGLMAGAYTVTVTDANGCTATFSTTLSNPAPILPNVTTDSVSCRGGNDGSATANPSGGSGVYTNFTWSSSANTTSTESGLSANTYTVTVTDDQGCTGSATFTIFEPATALTANLSKSDVDCFGNTNGSINTTPSGGVSPYSYAWSDGPSTMQNRSGLAAGTYTVSITDANGCIFIDSIDVNSRPEILINTRKVDNLCNGAANGSITATISGGTPNYSFTWSNAVSGSGDSTTISNLTAGTYTITVTDALNCTKEDSVTITEPTAISITVDSQSDPLCNGGVDGSIDISINGGTPNYSYLWNDAITSQDRTAISAGTYTVTVTDANGCTEVETITLNEPTALSISIDSLDSATCNGLNDGFASALASGGTSPYSYAWSNGPLTRTNPNLAAGTYTVTVTDANGCTLTDSAIVSQPITVIASLNGTNASCAGINDGRVVVTASGGTTPYTYNWDPGNPNGQGTDTISNLSGGTYTVTVTDANGCNAVQSTTINQPSAITLSATVNNANCNGDSTGSVTVNASGGTSPFTYLWDDPSAQTTATASNLPAGLYSVTVTDANGCTSTIGAGVGEPSAITASISGTNPTCSGINDGSATVSASGGTGTLTFVWSDSASQTTATASNLAAGTYTVTVTDLNGCTTTAQTTLTAPTAISILTDSLSNVSCNGGNDGFIRVLGSGGTPPYTYNWNGGIPGNTRSSLIAGSYTVTVSDANGCSNSTTLNISEPAALTLNLNPSNEQCFAANDGSVTATPSGGTTPYSYLWSDPSAQTTATASGLSPGTYTVTLTDANGCTISDSASVSAAALIVFSTTSTNVSCNGGNDGTALATASGGAGGFTYSWSIPATGASQTNLAAGTYTVTATDANGCTITNSVIINQPNAINASLSTTDVNCAASNGTAKVTPSGGTPPYTFNWGPGSPIGQGTDSISNLAAGNYTLTLSDANACDTVLSFTINSVGSSFSFTDSIVNNPCNGDSLGSIDILNLTGGTPPFTFAWSNGAGNSSSNSNLAAGTYTLTLSDASSCDSIISFTINEPLPLSSGLVTTDESCGSGGDGEADASGSSGGTPPYSYLWSTMDTTAVIDSLTSGSYFLTITDANGCRFLDTAIINSGGNIDPNEIIADATCPSNCNGSIRLSPSGGTAPYTYLWDNASTNFIRVALCPGNYTVTITDANSCSRVSSFTVGPDSIQTNLSLNSASCGLSDGSASVTGTTGGTPPYTFNWGPGSPTGQGTDSISNLSAGNYSLTITDANSCTIVENFTIADSANFTISLDSTDVSCNGGNDGTITVNLGAGATAPITYNWTGGLSGANPTNVPAGTYTVTVTDSSGCSRIDSITVNEPPVLEGTILTEDEDCGLSDGTASVTPSGGTPPYTFNWGPGSPIGQGTDSISNLAAGNYTLTLSDANACDTVLTFTINSIGSNFSFTDSIVNNPCNGDSLGSIDITGLSGGTPPFTFAWSNGAGNTSNNSNLAAGTYTLTLSDANNCDSIISFIISEPLPLSSGLVTTDESCGSGGDGEADASGSSGGTPPYSYLWSTMDTTAVIDSLTSGSYFLTDF